MLAVPTKVTALHITRVINSHSLSILARYSPFACPVDLGNPIPFMLNGVEFNKRFLKIVEVLRKPTSLTRGLRTPWKEEITSLFSLPGIPEEGEFSEAVDIIRDLQKTTSANLLCENVCALSASIHCHNK